LVIEHLRNGALTLASSQKYKSESFYYFCFTRPKRVNNSIKLFGAWLKEEFLATAQTCDTILHDHLAMSSLLGRAPAPRQAARARPEKTAAYSRAPPSMKPLARRGRAD
jgi:hypothetical protein